MDNHKQNQKQIIRHGQSYAPFGSISPRSKQKRNKKNKSPYTTDPGPGSYNVSLPIIQPIVQTIKKKNNNVIVKLGHIGTASFQGNQDRFKIKLKSNDIGPGQYLHQKSLQNSRKKSDRPMRHYAAQMLSSVIGQQGKIQRTPTIPNMKTLQLQQYMQMPNKNVIVQNHLINQNYQSKKIKSQQRVKGVAWSRMKQQRSFQLLNKRGSQLGPGSYQLQKQISKNNKHSILPNSAFVSQSVRSFFDQIYFDTNHMIKAQQRQERNYKGDSIGPGSYQASKQYKPIQYKYQFFGSTSERM